ncbi:hypothetical protein QR680_014636 [Steinernema hermaphroditum]|uniref:C-type lectin domain-containing protein n=1 Tax=Steinernema hermaphroditum TaxID=289476 RepID=A0AA39M4L1_9BILA|nr:hypothetical protein QR680_014636 [Steinernema hermaphroditum]
MRVLTFLFSSLIPTFLCQLWCGKNGFQTFADGNDNKYRCVNYYNVSLDFNGGKEFCAKKGAKLASIHSKDDNDVLGMFTFQGGAYWLGGQDANNNGTWTWQDGSHFDYSNWAAGQPSTESGKNCLEVDPISELWSATDCSEKRAVTCIKPLVYPDAQPPPIECWGEYCYQFLDGIAAWDIAAQTCKMKGGNLASIHSAKDQRLMEPIATSNGIDSYWIGGQVNVNNTLSWIDGSKVNYSNYLSDWPMYSLGRCLCMDGASQQWITDHCDVKLFALCELPRRND